MQAGHTHTHAHARWQAGRCARRWPGGQTGIHARWQARTPLLPHASSQWASPCRYRPWCQCHQPPRPNQHLQRIPSTCMTTRVVSPIMQPTIMSRQICVPSTLLKERDMRTSGACTCESSRPRLRPRLGARPRLEPAAPRPRPPLMPPKLPPGAAAAGAAGAAAPPSACTHRGMQRYHHWDWPSTSYDYVCSLVPGCRAASGKTCMLD